MNGVVYAHDSRMKGASSVSTTEAVTVGMIFVVVLLAVIAAIVAAYSRYYGNRAARFAYPTRSAYLRAVPQTDEEKREAVDQAFLGLVICLLGLLLPPFLLVGLVPLFFGGRKAVYVLMGLGYVDDVDQPGA